MEEVKPPQVEEPQPGPELTPEQKRELVFKLVLKYGIEHADFSLQQLLPVKLANKMFHKAADHPDVWRALATKDGYVTEGLTDAELKGRYKYTVGYHIPNKVLVEKKDYAKRSKCTCKAACCCITGSTAGISTIGGIGECAAFCHGGVPALAHIILWAAPVVLIILPSVICIVGCKAHDSKLNNRISESTSRLERFQQSFQGQAQFFKPLRRLSDPEVVTMGDDATNTSLQGNINNDNNADAVVAQPAKIRMDERTPLLTPKHL